MFAHFLFNFNYNYILYQAFPSRRVLFNCYYCCCHFHVLPFWTLYALTGDLTWIFGSCARWQLNFLKWVLNIGVKVQFSQLNYAYSIDCSLHYMPFHLNYFYMWYLGLGYLKLWSIGDVEVKHFYFTMFNTMLIWFCSEIISQKTFKFSLICWVISEATSNLTFIYCFQMCSQQNFWF